MDYQFFVTDRPIYIRNGRSKNLSERTFADLLLDAAPRDVVYSWLISQQVIDHIEEITGLGFMPRYERHDPGGPLIVFVCLPRSGGFDYSIIRRT